MALAAGRDKAIRESVFSEDPGVFLERLTGTQGNQVVKTEPISLYPSRVLLR